METHIYDEKNGLSYTLHGDYYLPNLVLNEEKPIYGKYGMLRKQFLKEHRLAKYQYLLLTGKLTEHLNIFGLPCVEPEPREQRRIADAAVQIGQRRKDLPGDRRGDLRGVGRQNIVPDFVVDFAKRIG